MDIYIYIYNIERERWIERERERDVVLILCVKHGTCLSGPQDWASGASGGYFCRLARRSRETERPREWGLGRFWAPEATPIAVAGQRTMDLFRPKIARSELEKR